MALVQFLILAMSLLVGCTTIENDRSTNTPRLVYDTQVDMQPLTRERRIYLTQIENHHYRTAKKPLVDFLETMRKERQEKYDSVQKEFPECKTQRHCISQQVTSDIRRLEHYNQLLSAIRRYDFQILDMESKLADLERNHEFKLRYVYNRYLYGEVVRTTQANKNLRQVLLHSLETFPSRRAISQKLLTYTDKDASNFFLNDLNFTMLGKPVDEAALLLSLDVWKNSQDGPQHYLVTILINAHNLDDQSYEKSFLREWANQFAEPDGSKLKKSVFCGLYSIASDSLVTKMQFAKIEACLKERLKMRSIHADKFADRFDPSNWLLPIAYFDLKD